jgi:hypothetical protein
MLIASPNILLLFVDSSVYLLIICNKCQESIQRKRVLNGVSEEPEELGANHVIEEPEVNHVIEEPEVNHVNGVNKKEDVPHFTAQFLEYLN